MTAPDGPAGLVSDADPRLAATLRGLARTRRLVFFAGLPGTGKSLLSHQLAHLAHTARRTVHLLQWDTARPVFEASPAAGRYRIVDGVTHGAIRKAVGLWARQALVRWHQQHAGDEHLLIGETPFVGHRLVELAQSRNDAAEPLLAAATTTFVIPVPSRAVRLHLETERERRAARPLHEQEREDAPPQVLRDLWRELVAIAPRLGLARPAVGATTDPPFDPELYRRVYERLLTHRHALSLPLDTILPTAGLTVYDFAVERRDLLPTADEVATFIERVERTYADPDALHREIDRWYVT